jgi:hypothetical protein
VVEEPASLEIKRPVVIPGDVQAEYYPDGYPKLPERLDRRSKPPLSEAA